MRGDPRNSAAMKHLFAEIEKVDALGGKYHHIKHLIEETSLAWMDQHLDLLKIEELFGMSAEKIAEAIVSRLSYG